MGTSGSRAVNAESQKGQADNGDCDVAGEEVRNAETANESREAVEEKNDAEHEDADPRHIRLPVASERKIATVDALHIEGTLESEEADANGCPRDQRAQGRQVG